MLILRTLLYGRAAWPQMGGIFNVIRTTSCRCNASRKKLFLDCFVSVRSSHLLMVAELRQLILPFLTEFVSSVFMRPR
jgi:hypothetical protein